MHAFVFGPLNSTAAAYGMSEMQVQLVQGYLSYLTAAFVAPGFQATVLGQPLGAKSGGLVAARPVGDWLTGQHTLQLHARVMSQISYHVPCPAKQVTVCPW